MMMHISAKNSTPAKLVRRSSFTIDLYVLAISLNSVATGSAATFYLNLA
jgi:hypothetical protein